MTQDASARLSKRTIVRAARQMDESGIDFGFRGYPLSPEEAASYCLDPQPWLDWADEEWILAQDGLPPPPRPPAARPPQPPKSKGGGK